MDKERNRKLLHELLDMVLSANGMEERKQELTGNKPTAFFEYSGHVNTLEIRVYKNGWSLDSSVDDAFWFDLNLDKDISNETMENIGLVFKVATDGKEGNVRG